MRLLHLCLVTIPLLVPVNSSFAQNPFEEPKNLKVLPKSLKGDALRQVMRRFSFAIGEKCSYCHDRVEDENGTRMVWDTDENDMKRVTREMIKLVGHIRQTSANLYPNNLDHKPTIVVCTTCHRGQANPFLIEEVMNNEIATGGTGAAKAKYLELKERYYGSHTYDFTGFTLAEYANRLILGGELDNALEMANFSREQFPNDAYAHSIVGDVYMKQENYIEAIKAYEASLAIEPDQNGIKDQIKTANEAISK